jgi:hypothetical protein
MKASSASEVPATTGQVDEYLRYCVNATKSGVKTALKKASPNKDRMQEILESEELSKAICDLIIEKTKSLSVTNEFANERVSSSYCYLSGYKRPKSMAEQVAILRKLFDKFVLGTYDETLSIQVEEAEGCFAVIDWRLVASSYSEAVQKVLDLLKVVYKGNFVNYREGKLGLKYLRQHSRTIQKMELLAAQQSGHSIMVVPAQFGIMHAGESVRCARGGMPYREFGLDPFSVGIMLLTHPERLQQYDDLWIDCPGGEYSPDADGAFDDAPYFHFHDGKLKFGTGRVGRAYENYGSASAFLPQ